MTDNDARAQYLVGWLEGFAPSVWLLAEPSANNDHPLVSDDACARYEQVVTELAEVMGLRKGSEG